MAYKCLLDYAAFLAPYGDCIEIGGVCLSTFTTEDSNIHHSGVFIALILMSVTRLFCLFNALSRLCRHNIFQTFSACISRVITCLITASGARRHFSFYIFWRDLITDL